MKIEITPLKVLEIARLISSLNFRPFEKYDYYGYDVSCPNPMIAEDPTDKNTVYILDGDTFSKCTINEDGTGEGYHIQLNGSLAG